jgi:hypothetical protein
LSGEAPSTAELAASFLLKATEPSSYNVVFTQPEFATDHAAASQRVVKEWSDFLSSNPITDQVSRADRYEEFRKSASSASELWSELNNTFFWHPGEYQLRFSIAVEKPAPQMVQEWRFRLSEEDIESLRLNVVGVVEGLAAIPSTLNFAYPKYEDAAPMALKR